MFAAEKLHTILTLNLTSYKFYLILMSLSPIYDPHPPAHTESSPPSDFNFIILQKIMLPDVLHCLRATDNVQNF
jgi:hypothetical protein